MNALSTILSLSTIFFVIAIAGVFLVIVARVGTPISSKAKFAVIGICCGLLVLCIPVVCLLPKSGLIKSKYITTAQLNESSQVFHDNVVAAGKYSSPALKPLKTFCFDKATGSIKIDNSKASTTIKGCSFNNLVNWRQKDVNDGKITVYVYSSINSNGINLCMTARLPEADFDGNTLKIKASGDSSGITDILKYDDIFSFDDKSAINQFNSNIYFNNYVAESTTNVVVLVPKGVNVKGSKNLKLPNIEK